MSDTLQVSLDDNQLLTDAERGRAASVAIVAIAAGLMGIGAVTTFSAAQTVDRPMLGWEFWKYPAIRQMVFVAGGMLAMLIMAKVPYRIWFARRGWVARLALLLAFFMLMLVYVPGIGEESHGAKRWVQLKAGSFNLQFQPSELIKFTLPIFLAYWLAREGDTQVAGKEGDPLRIRKFWRGFLPAVVVIGVCVVGVGIEDFGTAALLAAVAGAMLLVAGAKWHHVLMLILPSLPAFGYLLISKAHRMERLLTFLDIWRDPERSGYQAIQSLCTIASGGWWGRGLGGGFVKGYLPEARNDFIFAVICEEMGMIGAVAIIVLLIALMVKSLSVINICRDPHGRLLAFGIALTIGLQALMNIAVVTVSVPTKGISLPLVSAGGTGVILLGALVGILANIARNKPKVVSRTEN